MTEQLCILRDRIAIISDAATDCAQALNEVVSELCVLHDRIEGLRERLESRAGRQDAPAVESAVQEAVSPVAGMVAGGG